MTDHNPYLVNEHLSGFLGFMKRNFAPNSQKALEAQHRHLNRQLQKQDIRQEIEKTRKKLHGHGSGHSQLIPHMSFHR